MTKLLQLDEIDYKDDLYTLISDPSLVGDARRSKRINLNKLPAKGRIWDITPIVSPMQTPNLEFNDLFQMNLDAGQLSIDQNSPLVNVGGSPIYKHGCAKSNINLGMLNDGDSWHVGFRIVTNGTGFCLDNLMFYDKNATASSLAADYLNSISNNVQITAPTLIVSANRSNAQLTVNGSFYNPVFDSYVTSSGPYPVKYSFSTQTANNNTVLLLLSRTGNTLNAAIASVDTAGNYDIHELHHLGNDTHPFEFDNLAMFIYAGTVLSSQLEYQVISPTLTVGLPSYDVLNTNYDVNYNGTQELFYEAFAVIPHRPSGVIIEQPTFPPYTRVGEFLNTYLDPNYNGPASKPYGINYGLETNKTVIVTSTAANNESFELMVREPEFNELATTVANLANNAVQNLSYGEIVVYVKNALNSEELFTGEMSFDTFDAAYEHLVVLPAFLPKRIVIDDRPIGNGQQIFIDGVAQKLYLIGQNNIKLSTYCAFSGEPYPACHSENSDFPRPWSGAFPELYLRAKFDACYFVDYWGSMDCNAYGSEQLVLSGYVDTPSSPTTLFTSKLRVGKNSAVYIFSGSVDYYDGGSILLEDNAYMYLRFEHYKNNGLDPLNSPFTIYKSGKARLEIDVAINYQTLPLNGEPYQFRIINPKNGILPFIISTVFSQYVDIVQINVNYEPIFTVDNVRMIRSLIDFKPGFNYEPVLMLPDNATVFFIVGEVNLQGYPLYTSNSQAVHRFIGFPDAKLISSAPILVSNDENGQNSFVVDGVTLECPTEPVIFMESGSVTVRNSKIVSPKGIGYNAQGDGGTPYLNSLIKLQNVEFYSDNRQNETSIVKLNSRGDVVISDVVFTGNGVGGIPLLDLINLENNTSIIIDGLSVKLDINVLSPLICIDNNPRPPCSISVKGVHIGHGASQQQAPSAYNLFTLDPSGAAAGNYSVYDHTTDNRIVTDNSKPFMIYNDPSIVTTPDQIGADVFVFLEQSVTGFESMKYGFENDQNGRLIYLSDIAGMFEIRIKGTVISDPNTDVEFRFRQSNPTDAVGHNKFLSVNTGVTGVVDVDMLLHRSLMPSGIYGLAIRNQSNLANVELSNLLFTIREF